MTEEQPKKQRSKPDKPERRRRIDIIESLLIDCASITEMRRYFADKEQIHLSRRTIERYRELAEQRLVKIAEPVREQQIQLARLRLERCYARAITGGKKNIFAAISAQKAINVLLGLNPPKDPGEQMNFEQLAHMMVLHHNEMERQKNGAIGIVHEMTDLFKRYQSLGKDPERLLHELARFIEPGNDPNA